MALAFVDAPPAGVARTDAVVPSSCAFWRQAETEVFYAPAAAHLNCALGAMVMGFDLPAAQMDTLQSGGEDDVRPRLRARRGGRARSQGGEEGGGHRVRTAQALSRAARRRSGVGLARAGDGARARPAASSTGPEPPAGILGRPGCGSIPTALGAGRAVQSLGCTGMRLNTNIGPELSLMVLPGKVLETLAQDLERTCRLHAQLEDHYRAKAARLSAA